MANCTEEDCYDIRLLRHLFPVSCLVISVLAGLVIQSFIVAVNVIDWMKRRSLTGADKIITSIGMSRIVLHIASLLYCFSVLCSVDFPKLFREFAKYIFYSSGFFIVCLSSLLSIFFYFNISTSHNVFFLRLKAIISRRVVFLIMASVMFSLGYTSIYFLATSSICNSTENYISDYKQREKLMLYFYLLCETFPVIMVFTTLALLIHLLCIHIRIMNNCGNITRRTDTYHRILKFMVVSLLIWALHFMTSIFDIYALFLDYLWIILIVNILSVVHSILLIYVARKLRNHFYMIVNCGMDVLLNTEAPGPRSTEPVEVTPL